MHISLSETRHAVITDLITSDVKGARIYVGHERLGVTGAHYVHRSKKFQKEVVTALGEFIGEIAKHTEVPLYA